MCGKWIKPKRRAQIIKRDDGMCVYCKGLGESLDHVVARERGGDNKSSNLVTACFRCNSRKGDMPTIVWLRKLSDESGEPLDEISRRVRRHRERRLPQLDD
jgi:5-methylcytosine-specific restriction endonuclease McrA